MNIDFLKKKIEKKPKSKTTNAKFTYDQNKIFKKLNLIFSTTIFDN